MYSTGKTSLRIRPSGFLRCYYIYPTIPCPSRDPLTPHLHTSPRFPLSQDFQLLKEYPFANMPNLSDESTPEIQEAHAQALKRKASQAGLDSTGQARAVKRRASKACQCCRARKVRCNVTEHGAPCTNCRLDEVECIVSESRRKK